jgi:hypothetical protein
VDLNVVANVVGFDVVLAVVANVVGFDGGRAKP